MTDPWRQPDPGPPVPPAPWTFHGDYYGTASQPQHGYAPYQPPPLPKRGGYKRLVLILGSVGTLVLGGCGIGIYFAAHSVSTDFHAANVFLGEVRSQQFSAAYERLCPSEQARGTEAQFVSLLQAAAARGHGVARFDISSANTTESFGNGGTSRTASGTVTFTSGASTQVTLGMGKNGGRLCISDGYETLF